MLGIPAAEASSHMQMPDLGSRTGQTDCDRWRKGLMEWRRWWRQPRRWWWWWWWWWWWSWKYIVVLVDDSASSVSSSSPLLPSSAKKRSHLQSAIFHDRSSFSTRLRSTKRGQTLSQVRLNSWKWQESHGYQTRNGVSKRKHLNQHQISKPWLRHILTLNQVFNSMSKG